jgi:DNA-binding NarL/FixJ family response regulator
MPPDPLENISEDALRRLTDDQRIICALIARGMASKAIASLLDIGLRTVELKRSKAASTLGIETDVLIIWAARNINRLPDEIPSPSTPPAA